MISRAILVIHIGFSGEVQDQKPLFLPFSLHEIEKEDEVIEIKSQELDLFAQPHVKPSSEGKNSPNISWIF